LAPVRRVSADGGKGRASGFFAGDGDGKLGAGESARARAAMYPRHRLDSLADAIFGVAMTLLVLEIRLPEGVAIGSNGELLRQLGAVAPRFLPYVLSFLVLGLRWRGSIRHHLGDVLVGRAYMHLWLLHMLLVTCMPFSTLVLGRYGNLPAAIWLYAANLAAMALTALGLVRTAPPEERDQAREMWTTNLVLLGSCGLAIVLSLVDLRIAPFAFALNALTGPRKPSSGSKAPPSPAA
jgi:uncharacterized membrane protein